MKAHKAYQYFLLSRLCISYTTSLASKHSPSLTVSFMPMAPPSAMIVRLLEAPLQQINRLDQDALSKHQGRFP